MTNSFFGITSIVFGVISILCFGSGIGFLTMIVSFVSAFICIADDTKYKWSGILGASLAGVAFLICSINLLLRAGALGNLIKDNPVNLNDSSVESEVKAEDITYETPVDSSAVFEKTDEVSDEIIENNSLQPEMETEISDDSFNVETSNEAIEQSTENNTYRINDTWIVPNQWSVTITGVEETDYRNEYNEKMPEAVYYLYYTYENLGYVAPDGYGDGLYINFGNETIVDSDGQMGYFYPGEISDYPQEIPVGAYIEATNCIGVEHAGDFSITINVYDSNNEKQTATFEIAVE